MRGRRRIFGYDAGLGFETKIVVARRRNCFAQFLAIRDPRNDCSRVSPTRINRAKFRLTRRCLEVAAAANQPIIIITKNALVLRDLDLLTPMAEAGLVHVNMSVTTLDAELGRSMEPRASTPAARLRAIRELTNAGVPVRALIAPIVPGLTDSELPAILAAAKDAGAHAANYILLRLPLAVAPVFLEWVARVHPDKKDRIEGRIRDIRGGKLNDPRFVTRMRGTGILAEQIAQLFHVFSKRLGLDRKLPPLDYSRFQPPPDGSGQGRLF